MMKEINIKNVVRFLNQTIIQVEYKIDILLILVDSKYLRKFVDILLAFIDVDRFLLFFLISENI